MYSKSLVILFGELIKYINFAMHEGDKYLSKWIEI